MKAIATRLSNLSRTSNGSVKVDMDDYSIHTKVRLTRAIKSDGDDPTVGRLLSIVAGNVFAQLPDFDDLIEQGQVENPSAKNNAKYKTVKTVEVNGHTVQITLYFKYAYLTTVKVVSASETVFVSSAGRLLYELDPKSRPLLTGDTDEPSEVADHDTPVDTEEPRTGQYL